ncbi:glyoxylase-like metal-dependent hydrolase (beta-lactamase superfamily II) [Haloferula luteola]|uniref:Glyoxylase-like metal-dependent hydrolase (Beta-lactamase superfamily II) n=1 Tax=Haloferula luteola TaxID=595692 RepID=A0A840VBI4_9BACT|nr:MBL fold metallo-hydrolase [Haloferula luteola]MBB5352038.1 glyoxylase-like metal-dependent hydrolase (beta-lactamase superfamily II) [Haloferula luteola]
MTLYDTLADVVRKAILGQNLEPAGIADALGMKLADFRVRLDAGALPPELLAEALGLSLPGLEAVATTDRPFPPLELWIERLELPFEDETVNAWWMESSEGSLLIDSGLTAADLHAALAGRLPDCLLITHAHRDHIGGLSALGPNIRRILPGDAISGPYSIAGFEIAPFDLAGHHPQAVGYEIRRTSAPNSVALAVGDAVFASSMGGCPSPEAFQSACSTLAAAWQGRPADTWVLPGHGAATTVGLERTYNPFVPCWDRKGLTL